MGRLRSPRRTAAIPVVTGYATALLPSGMAAPSKETTLSRLQELREQDMITQAEYEAKARELMAREAA